MFPLKNFLNHVMIVPLYFLGLQVLKKQTHKQTKNYFSGAFLLQEF